MMQSSLHAKAHELLFTKNTDIKTIYFIKAFILTVVLFSSISCTSHLNENKENTTQSQKLIVALYPYLPRKEQFQATLAAAWEAQGTGIPLEFSDYDCYDADPPDSIDVFVFDGIYYSYFMSQGYLRQIPIDSVNDWEGFMNFAWDAVWRNKIIYGVPYLGCSNVYFYRKLDHTLDSLQQNGLDALYEVLGNSTAPNDTVPPPGNGLLIDLTSGTTDACMYLMSEMNLANDYSQNPYLPSGSNLSDNVIDHLNLYTKMAGVAQATYEDPGGKRIQWFSQGYGRSLVGITEDLCSFPSSYLDSVTFEILPTADTYLPITEEFFVDIAAINSKVMEDKMPYAMLLLNLMTSHDVMYKSMIPENSSENPQFLMPVRGAVLADLMDVHPLYGDMASMILNYYGQPLEIDSRARGWIDSNKSSYTSSNS
jgi:thiamine pyridinylase